MLAELLTAKEALQRMVVIDEQIETVTRALCPCVRGVPVPPAMDEATIDKLIDLKAGLQAQRRATASLVHELCALERQNPGRANKVEQDRRRNADALDGARRLLEVREDLRC
jgi:hypothetical protein